MKLIEVFIYFLGECMNKECQYLHVDPESRIRDCPWYDRGFCKHGKHWTAFDNVDLNMVVIYMQQQFQRIENIQFKITLCTMTMHTLFGISLILYRLTTYAIK